MEQERAAMIALRDDAMRRGMPDLAIVYSWAAIRLGIELLSARVAQLYLARQ